MIISASRRTDIPACYSDWFFQRLQAGSVFTRNPMRYHQVSKISLLPQDVDGIVFWTKNPAPMLGRLVLLQPFPYYFQFTLTAYGRDMEPNVPPKGSQVIPTFQRLAESIGPERVVWRYDPILLNQKYSLAYHAHYFREIASLLSGYTRTCIISFIDHYRGADRRLKSCGLIEINDPIKEKLAETLSQSARQYGMRLCTCAEEIDLSKYGICHAKCIDGRLLDTLRGYAAGHTKDRNQRPACGCDLSVDIGMYSTCKNGCAYCYANHGEQTVRKNILLHDPASPLLTGGIEKEDVMKDRR